MVCARAQVHFLPPPTLPEREINHAEEEQLQFLASARIAIHDMISKRKVRMPTQKLSLGSLLCRCACVHVQVNVMETGTLVYWMSVCDR